MNRTIKQIRDIEVIENELIGTHAGVLATHGEDDAVIQIPTTFLYKDKNLYVFFEEDSELYETFTFDSPVVFTIIKEEKLRKTKKTDNKPTYKYLSISISGMIRKVDETKTLDELKLAYAGKYSDRKEGSEFDFKSINKVAMVDTEEIKALEETGG